MSAPRFVPVTGRLHAGTPVPAWPGAAGAFAGEAAPDGSWVAWRLLGANNRELGRSASVFADLRQCAADVAALPQVLVNALTTVVVDLSTGQWVWHLGAADRRAVVSGRRYSRQRECRYGLMQFLALAPLAEVDPSLAAHCGPADLEVCR